VNPSLGGFEGFDITNPRGRFGGERFHLPCPKLGLEDAILSHTILVPDLLSCRRILHQFHVQIERGCTSSSCDLVKLISMEIEREIGDSGTWVILIIARSIFLESFRVFGGLLHQGRTS
jgi:hypothetical protein